MPEPGPFDAMQALAEAPAALLRLNANGAVEWVNRAALALLVTDALPPGTLLHDALGVAALPADASALWAPTAGRWLRLRYSELGDGARLACLEDVSDLNQAQAEVDRLAEVLEVAREFGRLGVWERNTRTQRGHWDDQVYAYWGLTPDTEAPGYDEATAAIVDEDRQAAIDQFWASTARAGAYSQRYRVRHADGRVHRLHEQWVVKNGTDGQPERMIGILMDDTEAWEQARAHSEVETQFGLAEALTSVARWRRDLRTDHVHFDANAYRLHGIAPRPDGVPLAELEDRVHPADRPRVHAANARALRTGEPVDTEVRVQHAQFGWRHLLMRRVVQRGADGTPETMLGVAFDITPRIRAQRQSLDFARRLDLATRSAGIGMWTIETATGRTQWSDQMRVLHGLAANTPIPSFSEWLNTYIHAADRERLSRAYASWNWKAANPAPFRQEFRLRLRDGSIRHIVAQSYVERQHGEAVLFGLAIDVTDRHLAEAALRSANERAALAARGAGVGTWELDLASGALHWDEQMWRLRGRQPAPVTLTMDDAVAMLHAEDRPLSMEQIDLYHRSPGVVERTFRVVWPGGNVRWIASRSTPVFDADGALVRRLGVNWDVTDAHVAQTERGERDLAEAASRAKTQFLSRMSHELRTPLNAVLGCAQLLQAESSTDAPARTRERIGQILAAGQHLATMVDDMLDLAAHEDGRLQYTREDLPLQEVIAPVLAMLGPVLVARSLPPISVEMSTQRAVVDGRRLRQALLNVVTHAVRLSRPAEPVVISVGEARGRTVVRVSFDPDGMAPRLLEQLFTPLHAVGATAPGTHGVGLSLARALIEGMGGHLRVTHPAGSRRAFELDLPTADPTAQPARTRQAAARPDAAPSSRPGGVVLYVEDNPVNVLIVREMLTLRGGMELHVATDGESGVRMARELRPDLVLLDLQLPDIDGHEVFRRLQADPATAGLRCVALSASVMPQDVQRALDSGLVDYWTKPLDLEQFMRGLDTLLSTDGRTGTR